jgi:hypothetical protein
MDKEMKTQSEKFCKSEFGLFLKRFFASEAISWIPVCQNQEPPDYFLDLNGNRFAVEVTALIKNIPIGTHRPRSRRVLVDELEKWVDEIEQTARTANYLRGHYRVLFSSPIDNFEKVKKTIRWKLLDYIRDTQNLTHAPETSVFKKGRQECTIEKLEYDDYEFDTVVIGGCILLDSAWLKDAVEEMCKLLKERIEEKAQLLRNVSQVKILLLDNNYVLADATRYRDCISRVPAMTSFHTIFIADHDKKSFILYSQNENWLH